MKKLVNIRDHCGFYCGEHSALVITPEFAVAFFRLDENHIVTALMNDGRVSAVVSGHQEGQACRSSMLVCPTRNRFVKPAKALDELTDLEHAFSECTVSFTDEGAVCTFDGRDFPLTLGNSLDMDTLLRPQPVNETLPVAEKMRRWNVKHWVYASEAGDAVRVTAGDGRFDCHWEANVESGVIYCRLGVNGYCEKGWAMKSTVVLRAQESRMLTDHRDALLPYQPIEDCFVADGCAFPEDGGWYWSVRQVTEDVVTLNGCGGETYTICRPC